MKKTTLAILLSLATLPVWAQMSPVGVWKTIDDDTKKEKSLVRITEANGVFSGTVEKFLDPDTKPGTTCDKCTDERKDKPVMGMTILRNLRQNAQEKDVFEGGDIVDPNNGKVYKSRVKTVDGGKKLEMRGYIGPFYRTQVWLRVE